MEDEVRAGRMLVHLSRTGDTVALPLGYQSSQFSSLGNITLSQVLDVVALLPLTDRKVALRNV